MVLKPKSFAQINYSQKLEKKQLNMLGDPIFYLHIKFGKAILIEGGDMPPN